MWPRICKNGLICKLLAKVFAPEIGPEWVGFGWNILIWVSFYVGVKFCFKYRHVGGLRSACQTLSTNTWRFDKLAIILFWVEICRWIACWMTFVCSSHNLGGSNMKWLGDRSIVRAISMLHWNKLICWSVLCMSHVMCSDWPIEFCVCCVMTRVVLAPCVCVWVCVCVYACRLRL